MTHSTGQTCRPSILALVGMWDHKLVPRHPELSLLCLGIEDALCYFLVSMGPQTVSDICKYRSALLPPPSYPIHQLDLE